MTYLVKSNDSVLLNGDKVNLILKKMTQCIFIFLNQKVILLSNAMSKKSTSADYHYKLMTVDIF